MPPKIKTVVIPAAGLGTRFLPATKALPKELIPVLDKPAIQYIVEECVRAGIKRVVFVISKGKESIGKYFRYDKELQRFLKKKGREIYLKHLNEISRKIEVSVVYQREPLGLGHAVLQAKKAVGKEPFAVILPDDIIVSVTPAIKQLMDIYEERNAPVVSIERIPKDKVSHYGVVEGVQIEERLYRLSNIVEKPKLEDAPSDLIVVGRYILPPETFDILKGLKPSKGGEIQLTDALVKLMHERDIYGFEFYGDKYDIGNRDGFIKANVAFALRDDGLRKIILESVKRWL